MVSFLRFLAQQRKMPGFPTHIVGNPTIRGKAQRYEGSREDKDRRTSGKEGKSHPPSFEMAHNQPIQAEEGTMYRAPTQERGERLHRSLKTRAIRQRFSAPADGLTPQNHPGSFGHLSEPALYSDHSTLLSTSAFQPRRR